MKHSFDVSDFPDLDAIIAADPDVTTESVWSDDTWYLDGESPGYSAAQRAIHWTGIDNPVIVNGLKYLAALLFIGRKGSKVYKHSTASTFSAGARYLAIFMHDCSYFDFDQLDEKAFERFKRQLETTLANPEVRSDQELVAEGVEEDLESDEVSTPAELNLNTKSVPDPDSDDADELTTTELDGGDDEDVSFSAAFYRLRTWKLLYDQRNLLQMALIATIPFDPFRGSSPRTLARKIADDSIESIPPVPLDVARPILHAAHRMIAEPADDIIALQRDYIGTMARMDREPPTLERMRLRSVMENFRFSEIPGEGRPWREPIGLDDSQAGGGIVLARLINTIRDACMLVLLSEVGLRIGEACSVQVEDREPSDDLPSCIDLRPSKSELNQHFFLRGLLSKFQQRPKEETWLVGARPIRTTFEPPTVRAIRVLEQLFRPWRNFSKNPQVRRQLIVSFVGSGLPRRPTSVRMVQAAKIRTAMQSFIAKSVDLKVLEPLVPDKPELRDYIDSNGRCVRPHQWRKSFLVYLLGVDDGLLPAISQHFKHYTLAITENGYMPKDLALLEEADSIKARMVTRYLYERRNGRQRSVSRLDRVIDDNFARIRELIGERTYDQAEPDLRELVEEHDVTIWFARHGRCLMALRPDEARCHEAVGNTDWKNRSPNFGERAPSLCLGCVNFSASAESIPFWRERYSNNQTAWIRSGYHRSFRVMRERAKQAAAVLRSLGSSLPMILVRADRHTSPFDEIEQRDRI